MAKYMVDSLDFPYCSGCGHTWINKSLGQALEKLGEKPSKINLITDIGCTGLVDKLFLTNTIHTTHGRSTAVATGMQLADQILFDNDAKHIIMIGDGGATIGLLHIIEAAKINCDLTVILHNNFVYGMTGGQNSGLTPEDFRTATTMGGNLTPALQIAKVLEAAHAPYISRKLATDQDLDDAILAAIKYPGFALVEVIELCTAYAVKWNPMSKKDVEEILNKMDSGELGEIVHRKDRVNFGKIYKECHPEKPQASSGSQGGTGTKLEVKQEIKLQQPISIVVAGTAGEGVQYAARNFAQQAVETGLNIVQKNDNPVTISTGFSLAEIKVSSEEILYSAIDLPDYLLISSEDGLHRAINYLEAILKSDQASTLIIDSSLVAMLKHYLIERNESLDKLEIISQDFRANGKREANKSMMALIKKDLAIN
ncbi:MAG: thiamine pyrophosphate-dependent enzyme [Candidatus Melainabacteria bacterium]|nr:thiamine pyrophosphate-dependent enzyme [Candidatus Melainabacteria bacterium]